MDDSFKPNGSIDNLAKRTISQVRAKVTSRLEMASFRRDVFKKAKNWGLNGNEFVSALLSMAIVSMKQMGLSNDDILTVVQTSPQFKEGQPSAESIDRQDSSLSEVREPSGGAQGGTESGGDHENN